MKYAYVARCDTNDSTFSQCYVIKYIDSKETRLSSLGTLFVSITRDEISPPVRRRRANDTYTWDYSNEPMSTRAFRRAYPHIRLKPGEGPILVDLDDVSTKRTSKHPED